MEYLEWEGVIEEGSYGAGPMIVWDRGVFQNISETRQGKPMELDEAIEKGDVKVFMLGEKIKGAYALVRTGPALRPGEVAPHQEARRGRRRPPQADLIAARVGAERADDRAGARGGGRARPVPQAPGAAAVRPALVSGHGHRGRGTDASELRRRFLRRRDRRFHSRGSRPGDRRAGRPRPALRRGGRRRGRPRRAAGAARLAQGAAAGEGPAGTRAPRRAGPASRRARRARHRRHGQDAGGCQRRGRPRHRVGRVGRRHPPSAQGREPRGGRVRHRRRAGAPAGRCGRRDHALQLPGDDPALVPALRGRLRERVHPQALGARPSPARSGSAS